MKAYPSERQNLDLWIEVNDENELFSILRNKLKWKERGGAGERGNPTPDTKAGAAARTKNLRPRGGA